MWKGHKQSLKMEEGTISQGMWVASSTRKGKETDSSLEPPEGTGSETL
jgi:hypothetical protein